MAKTRIALVDDHTLFRKGMMAILEDLEDVEVAFEANNGKELFDQMELHPVDLVLMDLEMPEMDGMDATKKMKQEYPDCKVLVLTMHKDEKFIIRVMELGANGFLLKTAQPEEIQEAIQSTIESGFFFTEMVSKVMLKGLVQRKKIIPTFKSQEEISGREREVLILICEELTTTEIAEKLFISPRTVEGHRNNLMTKIGARNLAGLVVYAIKHGYYDPE